MAGHRAVARPAAAGFSLVEILVVMSIALTLLALVAPAMRARDNASAEVRRVVADAARARSWARTTWRESTMDVDVTNRRWRIIDEEGEVLPSTSADTNGWRQLAAGISFQAVSGTSSDFAFAPDGRGTADAGVQIISGNSSWTVSMSAMTGTIAASAN